MNAKARAGLAGGLVIASVVGLGLVAPAAQATERPHAASTTVRPADWTVEGTYGNSTDCNNAGALGEAFGFWSDYLCWSADGNSYTLYGWN